MIDMRQGTGQQGRVLPDRAARATPRSLLLPPVQDGKRRQRRGRRQERSAGIKKKRQSGRANGRCRV